MLQQQQLQLFTTNALNKTPNKTPTTIHYSTEQRCQDKELCADKNNNERLNCYKKYPNPSTLSTAGMYSYQHGQQRPTMNE